MAAAPSPLSIEEYMATTYSPDREYVDGDLVDRNVGKGKHSYTQGSVFRKLAEIADIHGYIALVEQRVRVAPTRVRIPDVCLVTKLEEVITIPPLLCVEVRSPDDTLARIHQSFSDYFGMDVTHVWLVDPYRRRARVFDGENVAEIQDGGVLQAADFGIAIGLSEVLPPAEE